MNDIAIFENVNSTVKLSKTEKNILQLIARDCTVTIEKMAMELTITESTIKKALKHLRDHKIVIREGADKNGIKTEIIENITNLMNFICDSMSFEISVKFIEKKEKDNGK